MTSCPTNAQLMEYIGQKSANSIKVTTDASTWIAEHLENCSDCQAKMHAIIDDEQLGRWRDLAKNDPFYSNAKEELAGLASSKALNASASTTNNELLAHVDTKRTDDESELLSRPSAQVGQVLGNLEIIREIGHGGMATVFEAFDKVLNRKVALKQLDANRVDATSHIRFVREAKLLAAVKHPNVVAIYEVVDQPDRLPYYIMELINGGTLKSIAPGSLTYPELACIFEQISTGLQAVHASGVAHRDIKPSNVLLDSTSLATTSSKRQLPIPKLADFGLARATDQQIQLTQTNVLAGTPAYMSPEQVSGIEPTFATDIYSLGVTLYESLTGELPFRGSTRNLIQQITVGEYAPPRKLNADIPVDLETICMKCMRVQISDRYQSAKELAEDLHRFSRGFPILARPLNRREQLWRWAKRNPSTAWQVSIIASLLLFVAVGASITAGLLSKASSDLKAENLKVQQSQKEALQLAGVAASQRKLAIDSLNTLVNKVQQELANRPANLDLRRSLLQTAFEGLERISGTEDSDEHNLTTIAAHRRMSQISRLLGNSAEALTQINKSIELAEQSNQRAPENIAVQRELADAYFEKGVFYRAAASLDLASESYRRALELRQKVVDRTPDDKTAVGELLISRHTMADILWYQGKRSEAKQIFADLLDTTRLFLSQGNSDLNLKRMFGIACGRNAAILESENKLEQARSLHLESLDTANKLLTLNPQSLESDSDVGFALNRLTRFEKNAHNLERALELAQQTKEHFLKLANASPKDVHFQSLVGNCWHLEHEVLFDLNRFDQAIQSANAAKAIHLKLAELNPDTARFWQLAFEEELSIAGIELQRCNFEAASQNLSVAVNYLKKSQQAIDASPSPAVQNLIDQVNQIFASLELVNQPVELLLQQIAEKPIVIRLALSFQAMSLANRGNAEQAVERIEQLLRLGHDASSRGELVAQYVFNALHAAGLVHQLLSTDTSDETSKSQPVTSGNSINEQAEGKENGIGKNRIAAIAMELTEYLLTNFPHWRPRVVHPEFLKSLQRIPEYQQLLNR